MRSDTTPAGVREMPSIWTSTCERITGILESPASGTAGDVELATVRGASAADGLTHLTNVAAAAHEGLHGVVRPPAAGCADAGTAFTELIGRWKATVAAVLELIEDDPDHLGSRLVTEAVMFEHDLRSTLEVPGFRDDLAIKVALDEFSGRLSDRVDAAALPPLRVTVEQWGTIAGTGRAVRCVVADRFEFVRAMSGRRSAAEVRRWNWGVDADLYLPVLGEVELPPYDVQERDPRVPEHMRDREFVL